MTGLKLGYKASAEQFGARELVEFTVLAEQLGLDSAAVSDHFQPWRHTGGHAPFSLAWLVAAGERTERIQLGTSVMTPHYRYNPAVIAQSFATLGTLNPGRVMLGVGTGEALNEIATGWAGAQQTPGPRHDDGSSGAQQQPWPEFKERFARLREAVRLIRALWREERVNFDGDYYTTQDASIYDRPDQEIPVYIAAGGPTVAKYAGRVGDGFICTSGKGMGLYTDKLLPAAAQGAAINGRSLESIDRMIEIKLSYDPDPQAALENTRFWAPLSLSAEQKHSIKDPVQMEAAADALPIEQVASRWIVGSDPEAVTAQIKQYTDAGFNHLVFHGPGHDQRRFLELFAADLAPRLRGLSVGDVVQYDPEPAGNSA